MSDKVLLDLVNRVFLEYSPIYSTLPVKEEKQPVDDEQEQVKQEKGHEASQEHPDKHEGKLQIDSEHEEHSGHNGHGDGHDGHDSHNEHEDHEGHGHSEEHKGVHGHGHEAHGEHGSHDDLPETVNGSPTQSNTLSEAELLNRLAIGLPIKQAFESRFDIADEVKPKVSSELEHHVIEFGNKFIGADYPDIQIRQLYTGLNPTTYTAVRGGMMFGEFHSQANVYTDNRPVYTAMRSEKVNIKPEQNQPVYMRQRQHK